MNIRGNVAEICSTTTGAARKTIEVSGETLVATTRSADGKWLAIADEVGRTYLVDLSTNTSRLLHKTNDPTSVATSIALSSTGAYAAISLPHGSIIILDADRGTAIGEVRSGIIGRSVGIAFSQSEDGLFWWSEKIGIRRASLDGKDVKRVASSINDVTSVTFSRKTSRMAAATPRGDVKVFTLPNFDEIATLALDCSGPIQLSSDGRILYWTGRKGSVGRASISTPSAEDKIARSGGLDRWAESICVDEDAELFGVCFSDGVVEFFHTRTLERASKEADHHAGRVTMLTRHQRDGHVISAGTDGVVGVWNVETRERKAALKVSQEPLMGASMMSASGTLVAVTKSGHVLGCKEDGGAPASIQMGDEGAHVVGVGASLSQSMISFVRSGGIRDLTILREHEGKVDIHRLPLPFEPIAVSTSEDGWTMAAGTQHAVVLSPQRVSTVAPIPSEENGENLVAISILSGGLAACLMFEGGIVRFINLGSEKPVITDTLVRGRSTITSSSDGGLLVVGQDPYGMIIIESASLSEVAQAGKKSRLFVEKALFVSRDSKLVMADQYGLLHVANLLPKGNGEAVAVDGQGVERLAEMRGPLAYAAMLRLAGSSNVSDLIAKQIQIDASAVRDSTELIMQLSSDRPDVRQQAEFSLAQMNVEPQLEAARAHTKDPEALIRIHALLLRANIPLNCSIAMRGRLRMIQVLKWSQDTNARDVLRELSASAPWKIVRLRARMALESN